MNTNAGLNDPDVAHALQYGSDCALLAGATTDQIERLKQIVSRGGARKLLADRPSGLRQLGKIGLVIVALAIEELRLRKNGMTDAAISNARELERMLVTAEIATGEMLTKARHRKAANATNTKRRNAARAAQERWRNIALEARAAHPGWSRNRLAIHVRDRELEAGSTSGISTISEFLRREHIA